MTAIAEARLPLVLLVDPKVESRHWMWRILNKAFGVIEATNAVGARRWIDERPDIDAMIVDDELPDVRGIDLIDALAREAHPIAERAIVLASPGLRLHAGRRARQIVEPGDVHAILTKLTTWLVARDVGEARLLLKELRDFPESSRRIRLS